MVVSLQQFYIFNRTVAISISCFLLGGCGLELEPRINANDESYCVYEEEPCNVDCRGELDGTATIDSCGICDDIPSNDNSTCDYFDNLDGTINDAKQGLTWMKCAQGMSFDVENNECMDSHIAFQYCDSQTDACNGNQSSGLLNSSGNSGVWKTCDELEFAGRSDWRVPDRFELAGLVKCNDGPLGYPVVSNCGSQNKTAPTIELDFFNKFPDTTFWTSSAVANAAYYGYAVSFNTSMVHTRFKDDSWAVLCVR